MSQGPNKRMSLSQQLKNTFVVWLAIFPLITLLIYVFDSYLALLPLVGRTFLLTLVAVPITSYVIMPLYARLFRNWLK